MLDPDIVNETAEKIRLIREILRCVQSWQKSDADNRRWDLEFFVGDVVFLKVSPSKGVMTFGKSGKLAPRYNGSFEILNRVGLSVYRLALPPVLSCVHNVFHVSFLRKYVVDPSHMLEYEPIEIQEDLSYEERSVRILDMKEQILRNRKIALVKMLWQKHSIKEATWEHEEEIKDKCSRLCLDSCASNSDDRISVKRE